MATCYYCGSADGEKHLPECPKPRPFYGKTDEASGAALPLREIVDEVARRSFVEAQTNPTPPGTLRPPTRDELAAFERFQKPFWWLDWPVAS